MILSPLHSPFRCIFDNALYYHVSLQTILKITHFTRSFIDNTINEIIQLACKLEATNVKSHRLDKVCDVTLAPTLCKTIKLRPVPEEYFVSVKVGNDLAFPSKNLHPVGRLSIRWFTPVHKQIAMQIIFVQER